jgi:hypothetical protein
MDAAKVAQLKLFVQQCEANPAILQDPSLAFFRSYLEKLGAKVPAAAYGKTESTKAAPTVGDISCFSLFITLSLLMYIYI